MSSNPILVVADPYSSCCSKLNSDVRKARRGAHGLETMTLPPNDVFLSLHRVFLGRVKFGCQAHNLKVVGSNPTPATKIKPVNSMS